MNSEKLLKQLIKNNEKINANIDSICVSLGKEYSFYEYNEFKLHQLRSASKLVVGLVCGCVINSEAGGGFDLETKVFPILEKFISNKSDREKIEAWTIKTLLTHSTGFDKMMLKAKDVAMLDESQIFDLIFNTKINNTPNEVFTYNNVEAFLLSVVFQEVFNEKLSDFANEHIFKPLGITEYKWTEYGKYCAGCTGLFLSAKDFHKLGLLLLNKGEFKGKQIVSKSWIEELIKPQILTPSAYKAERVFPKFSAGYFTFQTKEGIVFRDGAGGQYLIVDAKSDVLVSILSDEKDVAKVSEIFRDTFLYHNEK